MKKKQMWVCEKIKYLSTVMESCANAKLIQ